MSDTAEDVVFLDMSLDELLSLDISKMSTSDAQALDEALQEVEAREVAKKCQTSLLAFCKHIDPSYTVGVHHRRLATLLEQVARGEKDRIAVSVAPRHGKSLLTSTYFPAWFLGNWPKQRVMMVTHTTDLSVDFGRKVRNIIDSAAYRQIFPAIKISADSKSAGRWGTNAGGEYYATSVGSALAGRGADLLIVDDPHSEQDLLTGNAFDNFADTFKWFASGARTRLSKEGRVALIHTRWHVIDLIGSVAKEMTRNPEADQYEFFEFPAILNENTANEKALWPEFFDLKALHRTKASMPAFQWNAQYQQSPTAEEASLVKREWWRLWDKDEPPDCEYIIMALDAAAEANNRADFTALTTWGVFTDDNLTQGASHIILLNAINVRVEFPELKDLALREYKEWEPDAFIVEKKSSGTPLFQELRRMGVPVSEFTPHRGTGDKIARLNAVADIFRSGMVWYPAGRRWAEEVIEQVASFPASENDDLVDTVSMSLARYRAGGFIRLASDEKDEPAIFRSQRQAAYY